MSARGGSVADFLELVGDDLPVALVSPAARERLAAVGRLLPVPGGQVVFESRLSADERTDLTLVYFPADVLDRIEPANPLTASLFEFAACWSEPPWNRIPSVAYEMDVLRDGAYAFVYPYVQPEHHRGFYAVAETEHRERQAGDEPSSIVLGRAMIKQYADPLFVDALVRQLHACSSALPHAGFVFHVAALDRRQAGPKGTLRVLVSVPTANVLEFLERLDWPGDRRWLADALPQFCPQQGRINFDVDFGVDGPHQRIGLFCDFLAPRRADRSLQQVLDYLATSKLARADKLAAVHAWVECVQQRFSDPVATRGLGFKLVHEHGSPHAKVYLPCYDWARASAETWSS